MAKIDLKLFKYRLHFIKISEEKVGGRVVESEEEAFTRWAARRNYTTTEVITMTANGSQMQNTQQYIIRQSLLDEDNPDITMKVHNPDDETQKLNIVSVEKDFLNQPFMLITVESGTI
ncbi:head-tail adaptor protein [Sporolactobacillus terrae]|uniref:Head-tail adaptor protein n=1 Tax=Sporolactobacillus terrae TaxID=269673 RepID=A0ABX5Q754_9BACL|nr:hypothetical protein [Sporolactobacillus terrae]QAA22465.1 hypothetical protein C0674_07415 [Sporolactobacillus terrae]QAA25439.1 hypothetical protein C0679_07395 [Sporolactobacillus terrae]UAK17249.1 hypothetical protein K7399_04735 [Sporolactobacillus terrae]